MRVRITWPSQLLSRAILHGLLLIGIVGVPDRRGIAQTSGENGGFPAGVADRSTLPEERSWNYQFDNVSIEQVSGWLEWFGLEFPVDLGGQVSGWLWVQRGDSGWLRIADYRLEGEFNSTALKIDDWTIDAARLRFGYFGNNWYVGNLSGIARLENLNAGRLKASTRIPTSASERIELEANWSDVKLAPLAQALGLDFSINNAPGDLRVKASMPLGSVSDLSTWRADASLDVATIQLPWIEQLGVNGNVRVLNGQWNFENSAVSLGEARMQISGGGSLQNTPTFDVQLLSEQLDIVSVAKQVKLQSTRDLAAKVSGIAELKGQLNGDAKQGLTNAKLSLRSNQLRILEEPFARLAVQAKYSGGDLQVVLDKVEVANGLAKGKLSWEPVDALAFGLPSRAELDLSDLNLAASRFLAELLPEQIRGAAGQVNGQLRWQIVTRDAMPEWSSDVRIRMDNDSGFGPSLRTLFLTASKTFSDSVLKLQVANADQSLRTEGELYFSPVEQGPVNAADLFRFERYEIQGSLDRFQARLPVADDLIVPLEAIGSFQIDGTKDELLRTSVGELSLLETFVANRKLSLSDVRFTVSPSQFRLERFRLLNDEQGQVVGSALLYRSPMAEENLKLPVEERPQHLLNLKVENWKLDAYLKAWLARTVKSPSANVRAILGNLGGDVSLVARLGKPADGTSWSSGWQGRIEGDASDLYVRNKTVGSLNFQADLKNSQLDSNVQGTLFGGSCSAQLVGLAWPAGQALSYESANLTLEDLRIERLAAVAVGDNTASRFTGRTSLKLQGQGPSLLDTQWALTANVPTFHSQGRSIARSLNLQATLDRQSLRIERIRGGVAGGRIQAKGQVGWQTELKGALAIDLQTLELANVSYLLPPDYAPPLDGTASFRGTMRIGGGANLAGTMRVHQASFVGLPVRSLHGSIRADLNRAFGFTKLTANDLSGNILGGRGSAELELRGGAHGGLSLTSNLKLRQGHMDQLSKALGFDNVVGTGRFDLATRITADRLTSIRDLYGSVHIDFGHADALSLPILGLLGQFAPLLQLATADINGGTLDALFGNGQLRIRSLLVNSNAFWLIAEGSAGLLSGRLDLQVLLQTGGGLETQAAAAAGQKLILAAAPQLLLLMEVTELLTNQSLYFNIRGTSKHPVIQPQVAQTLAKALIRNVRRQLLGVPTPVSFSD